MDTFINTLDQALRTLFASHHAARPNPAAGVATVQMTDAEKKEAGALMRVNHVGEVCAQALYASQALATRNPQLRQHFLHASAEETDHLAWTEARLHELGARPACSTQFGMQGRSVWASSPANWAVTRSAWALWWKQNVK